MTSHRLELPPVGEPLLVVEGLNKRYGAKQAVQESVQGKTKGPATETVRATETGKVGEVVLPYFAITITVSGDNEQIAAPMEDGTLVIISLFGVINKRLNRHLPQDQRRRMKLRPNLLR